MLSDDQMSINVVFALYFRSTRLLAQTTLRNVLGTKNLSDILAEREQISQFMQVNNNYTDVDKKFFFFNSGLGWGFSKKAKKGLIFYLMIIE